MDNKLNEMLRLAMGAGIINIHEALAVGAAVAFCQSFTEEQAGNNGLGSAWIPLLDEVTKSCAE